MNEVLNECVLFNMGTAMGKWESIPWTRLKEIVIPSLWIPVGMLIAYAENAHHSSPEDPSPTETAPAKIS